MKQLKTIITISIALISLTAIFSPVALANEKVSASSAALLQTSDVKEVDYRVKILHDYLARKNSPLAESAESFVAEADKNQLDWKLVAAISGLESGFGKHIPYQSYNGWGWGVYGDNVHNFDSWDDAITTISEGLRVNYMDKWKATDVASIGRIYAASPTWAQRVTYFMNDIEKFEENWADTTLSISI